MQQVHNTVPHLLTRCKLGSKLNELPERWEMMKSMLGSNLKKRPHRVNVIFDPMLIVVRILSVHC